MVLEWKHKNVLCTKIFVDFKSETVRIENYTESIIKRAFGVNNNPDINDFMDLVKRRCFSQNADGLKERLRQIGLDYYNPLDIISRTNGEMAEDYFTLTIIEE